MFTRKLSSERGVATLIALLMIGMLLLIGLAALTTSDDESQIAGNEWREMKAFYAAEAGLEQAMSTLQMEYDSTGLPPADMPEGEEAINDCQVTYQSVDDGAATMRPLSSGELAGLRALVKTFSVEATAVDSTDGNQIQMSQTFEVALVPIFQFAVFYGTDLEIAPGSDMSLIGRVHSNGNLYLQAASTLNMDSYVTASGNILHGRKGPGSVDAGDVKIKNASGTYTSMKMGSDWLDADYNKWYDSSLSRWGGRVKDSAHGQQALNLPLSSGDDPHAIIERADGGNSDSFENKATLKIVDGVAQQLQSDGAWHDVTAAMVADGTLKYTADKFTDKRENQKIDCTELDIAKMYSKGYAPSNGVVYFSDEKTSSTEWPALRLINGSKLDAGLTVASENPLYTLGNFNSTSKQPASLIADAVTFLSTNWADANSTLAKASRVAKATTVNASYLSGNVETTSSNYSGGFENLPRFLETWTGINFTWKGSAVNLWNSIQATGLWNGTYYDPPKRVWSYDTDLDDPTKLPPETPTIRIFQRTGWQQKYVGFATSSAE
jgi:hypothetical protein